MKKLSNYFRNMHTIKRSNDEFDDLYAEISRDWMSKAEDLQRRRWQKLHKMHV